MDSKINEYRAEMIRLADFEDGFKEGERKGVEKGREEGVSQRNAEIARTMLEKGFLQATGMFEE